jgi:hypothetical protein
MWMGMRDIADNADESLPFIQDTGSWMQRLPQRRSAQTQENRTDTEHTYQRRLNLGLLVNFSEIYSRASMEAAWKHFSTLSVVAIARLPPKTPLLGTLGLLAGSSRQAHLIGLARSLAPQFTKSASQATRDSVGLRFTG